MLKVINARMYVHEVDNYCKIHKQGGANIVWPTNKGFQDALQDEFEMISTNLFGINSCLWLLCAVAYSLWLYK